jgi:hypothetical protein
MNPALLADLIVVVHLGIVLFVVLGLVCVLLGGFLGWQWVRNPVFRIAHLALISFVAIQGAGLGQLCPLTIWENELRREAGEGGYSGSFVGRLCHDVLFVEVKQETLNWVYVAFAALVLATLLLVRPRWRRAPSRA